MTIQPSQPQSIGGVLDTAFRLYRASIVPVLPLSLILAASSVPIAVYQLSWSSSVLDSTDVAQTAAIMSRMLGDRVYWTLALVSLLVQLWLLAAMTLQINSVGTGQPVLLKAALAGAARRFIALIVMWFVYAIVVGITFLLVIGIILSISWILAYLEILLDSQGPMAALKRSRRLVWGNWWRTATILTVGLILLTILYMAFGMVVTAVSGLLGTARFLQIQVFSLVMGFIITPLVIPLYPALLLGIYWDLKLRKHGDDLAARVTALGASA